MDLFIVLVAVALFATMLMPLPAPAALAVVLWALDCGVPLPLVLALYLAQDVLSYLAIQRLLPALTRRHRSLSGIVARGAPAWLRRRLSGGVHGTASSRAGLFSASLVSFYAGAALATLHNGAALRSAAVVIAADVLKWANGLALALGLAHALPGSPWTTLAASAAGLALIPVLRALPRRQRPAPALAPVRVQ
ncbi:MAG TPA: hypothetical protein VKV26_15200 [Dehalococcoidia bacterium]|nr:hypothetical protein [Dehalococcoidia bacterium]